VSARTAIGCICGFVIVCAALIILNRILF